MIEYGMWDKNLLHYLKIIQFPLFTLSDNEIMKCFDEAINESALALMCMYSLTFLEAKIILLDLLLNVKIN